MRLLVIAWLLAITGSPAAPESPRDFAKRIYDRLVLVTGDRRRAPPLDVVEATRRNKEGRVAWFNPAAGTISIEERTIAVCRRLGSRAEACVAFFLGHELAHYYKDHAWGADFGSRFSATPLGARIKELSAEQRLGFETQADEFGAIYGYLAGYDTLGAAPAALEAVYRAFGVADGSTDYPSLKEREQIAKNSEKRLARFVPVFEAGNLLFAIGRYRDAVDCFEDITHTFASREMLNNAAIGLALASGSMDVEWYPWLLDSQTRLRPDFRQRSGGGLSEAERRQMLDSARRYLEEARERDPDYVPAEDNLAAVNDLLGHYGTAVDDAEHGFEIATKSGWRQAAAAACLVRAIANFHRGETRAVDADLAVCGDDAATLYWKAVTKGQSPPPRARAIGEKAGPDETFAGRPASAANPDGPPLTVSPGILLRARSMAQVLELHVQAHGGDLRAFVTRDSNQPTSRGVGRGADTASVKAAYGDPSRKHRTSAGEWYVYERAGLVVRFGPTGTVEGWSIYAWRE